jgi:hypothetical protein
MRHTATSLMIATGEPVTWVSSQPGHTNPAITLRVYAKLFNAKEHAEASRARIQEAYGSQVGGESAAIPQGFPLTRQQSVKTGLETELKPLAGTQGKSAAGRTPLDYRDAPTILGWGD